MDQVAWTELGRRKLGIYIGGTIGAASFFCISNKEWHIELEQLRSSVSVTKSGILNDLDHLMFYVQV